MRYLLSLTLLASVASTANAQQLDLPQDPRAWINSGPVSLETMKGKGVVFYFFEEG